MRGRSTDHTVPVRGARVVRGRHASYARLCDARRALVVTQSRAAARRGLALLDVALGLGGLAGVLARDQDQALELGYQDAVLVEDAGVDLDHAAVGL